MTRALPLVACLLAGACYTPRGAFVWADAYRGPGTSGEYVMVAGDVLQVNVFQQEANSARVRVRSDGCVSLPLLADQLAAGKTPVAFAAELQKKLKPFINNPLVTVSLEEPRPLTVSVVGEVMRAGTLPLEAGAGVLQALAAAGGLSDFAHRDGIFVLRTVAGSATTTRIRFTWDQLSRAEGRVALFTLMPSDVVVVE